MRALGWDKGTPDPHQGTSRALVNGGVAIEGSAEVCGQRIQPRPSTACALFGKFEGVMVIESVWGSAATGLGDLMTCGPVGSWSGAGDGLVFFASARCSELFG